jgi:hypothetical protein
MAKLKLKPDPTFKRKVGITTHDGKVVEVEFTFRHRSRDAAKLLEEEVKGKSDAEIILLVATGWELEDEFTADNLAVLSDNYVAASTEIFMEYLRALNGARLGN